MTTRKRSGCVETCAICLEKLPLPTQETPVSAFKCGHVFHFECTRPLYEQCFRTIMRKRREMRRSWLYINFMTEEQRSNAIIDIRRNATWPCPVCRYPVKKHDLNVRLPKLRRLPIAVMRRREKKSRLITIHDLGRELDQAGVRRPVRRLRLSPDHPNAFDERWYLEEVTEYEELYGELPTFNSTLHELLHPQIPGTPG